jgi:hypothetical protein
MPTAPASIIARGPDPGVYPCAACGTVGRTALVLRAVEAAPPLALWRACVFPAPPTVH